MGQIATINFLVQSMGHLGGVIDKHLMFPLTIYKEHKHHLYDEVRYLNKTENLPFHKAGSCFFYTLHNCFYQHYTSVVSLMGRCYSYHIHGVFLHMSTAS